MIRKIAQPLLVVALCGPGGYYAAARGAAPQRIAVTAVKFEFSAPEIRVKKGQPVTLEAVVEEIDRRLEDRFALLRGGDRSAPDRHRTLLAVIDWSWNLLDPAERRALRRLALFNDGFALEAAEAMLGDDALDALQGLVDQSLLSVRETPAGLRYRMLETVREFGLMQLGAAGEDADEGGEVDRRVRATVEVLRVVR